MQTALTQPEQRLLRGLKTISDDTRFKIFKLLLAEQELCVSSIAERLDISVSAVSQHFRQFEQAGLVDKHRYGQKICYVLKPSEPLVATLTSLSRQ
jgi:DNA-binding transcriptional ArsR family regulator